MAFIALFHSVLGLRPMEKGAADRLRAAGHEVVTPDLYEGQVGETIEDGFALYTDAELPDYDEQASTLTWQRALAFLHAS